MSIKKRKPVIGVSIGDINGIGPEVVMKAFSDDRVLNYCTPLIFCSKKLISNYKGIIEIDDFNYLPIKKPSQINHRKINLYCNWKDESEIKIGVSTDAAGEYALKSLQTAVSVLKDGDIDALVTAPINKKNIHSDEFQYFGHSKFLADYFDSSSHLMLFICDEIKLGVLTEHIPLSQVTSELSSEMIVEKVEVFNKSLEIDFCIKRPNIAVLGLNPHCSDGGLIGNEEEEIIIPALKILKDKGIIAMGPYSADGFFGDQMYRKFDGVLAIYHDQGLIPFKAMAFDRGVNYTAGLPIIRTSPVHGTAYSIAGKNIADEGSFREAMYLALKILKNRAMYKEITRDPLKSRMVKEKEDDN